MAEKRALARERKIVISWQPEGPVPQLCGMISAASLLAAIAVFFRGILNSSQHGTDWTFIAATISAALLFKYLGATIGRSKIVMTKKEVAFSICFSFELLCRLKRKWTDIGAIALQEEEHEIPPDDDEERRFMVFHFASGGSAKVPLKKLTVADLDNLFKASKRWGSTAVMAPELIELRRKLIAGPSPNTNLSLTTLWERELQSHFTTSTFVPLAAGSVLNNRFSVLSQIGAGGLSAIYLARNSDGQKIILKELVLHNHKEENVKKAKELFVRESGILLKLKHPQIARVYDHFVENGRDYLVLEYIPGQSLRQLVDNEGPRLEDKVLEWAQSIVSILIYLHGQSPPVLHRDITPENLVLGEDRLLHLIDFGAANEYVSSATGTVIGKQAYMSPEQFRGKPVPASDIYSLGATMYFLLTGQDPEALSSANPCRIKSSVSVETGNLVAKLTSTDVSERPASSNELLQMIADLRATERGAIISLG